MDLAGIYGYICGYGRLQISRLIRIAVILCSFAMVIAFSHGALADQCTYQTWDWDTIQKKAVHLRTISKLKSEITPEERGDTPDCSVCEEDQVEVRIDRVARFKICKAMSPQIVSAIKNAIAAGFPFSSIVGYRVGKSKGPLNSAGERTQFSNHSFGTAIDFNSEKNGLYDFCIRFSPNCKLLRGGAYIQDALGSITKDSSIYKEMLKAGFKWGGEISGKQKDFMHFSLSGF